jgi:hypothetical protein
MNYRKLIDTRKSLKRDIYTESHHIKPKSLGGDNSKSNLIDLTPKEHYIAHLLLAKIHKGKMWVALNYMMQGNTKSAKGVRVNSRLYAKAKIEASKYKSKAMLGEHNHFYGKNHTENSLLKMRKKRDSVSGSKNPNFGKKRPHHGWITKKIISYKPFKKEIKTGLLKTINKKTGVTKTKQLKEIITFYKKQESAKNAFLDRDYTGENNPNYGNGKKIKGENNPMFGRKQTEEARAKISEKAKRKINCPHCGKIGSTSNMKRWHFDNCKKLK